MIDLSLLVLVSLAVAALASLLSSRVRKHVVGTLPRRPSVLLEKGRSESTSEKAEEDERVPGDWKPLKFEYPSFEPDTTFDVHTTKPPGYRPFRWGKYYITMGIRAMQWEEWIQPDFHWPHYHAIKVDRMARQGDHVVRTQPPKDEEGVKVPGGELAAKELVHELAEYLSRRFPQMYTVTRKPPTEGDFGWYGEGEIKTIRIRASRSSSSEPLRGVDAEREAAATSDEGVDVEYDLDKEDPMAVAGLLVEDDLALMLEGTDGRYYFQAGSICLAGFWRLVDKIGLPLEEIHTRGRVPQYETKLHSSMARFFTKMKPSKPVVRNNYFVQVVSSLPPLPSLVSSTTPRTIDPDQIGWSDTTNGPEGVFDQRTKGPLFDDESGSGVGHEFSPPQPTTDPSAVRLRQERQSLRRLPISGAIVFTIRTYIDSIPDLAKEPGVPGRLASAMRSWGEDVAEYKGRELYQDAVLGYLDEAARKQVEEGICGEEEKNEKAYPF